MCGKFTQGVAWHTVNAFSRPLALGAGDGAQLTTPMRDSVVICLDDDGKRIVRDMRWGWPKLRAHSPLREPPHHMHAKGETIDDLPTFADSFAKRRGLMWVQTFNVGEELPSGKVRQWVCEHPERTPLALAVIYRDCDGGNDTTFPAFVMATAAANPQIAEKTDRMPAILHPGDIALYLGELGAPVQEVKTVLKPYPGPLVIREQAGARNTGTMQPSLF